MADAWICLDVVECIYVCVCVLGCRWVQTSLLWTTCVWRNLICMTQLQLLPDFAWCARPEKSAWPISEVSFALSLTHSIPRLYLHASLPLFRAGGQVLSDRHSLGSLSLSLSLSLFLFRQPVIIPRHRSYPNSHQMLVRASARMKEKEKERGGGEREKNHTHNWPSLGAVTVLTMVDDEDAAWWWRLLIWALVKQAWHS